VEYKPWNEQNVSQCTNQAHFYDEDSLFRIAI